MKRLAEAGAALLPGAVGAWALACCVHGVTEGFAGAAAAAALAGSLGLWTALFFCGLTLVAAAAGWPRDGAGTQADPRWSRALAGAGAGLAAGWLLGLLLGDLVTPATLDTRPVFVRLGRWVGAGLGASVGVAFARPSLGAAGLALALALALVRLGGAADLAVVFAGRPGLLALACLGAWVAALHRPPWVARLRPAAIALVTAVVALPIVYDAGAAGLSAAHPGPAAALGPVRAWFDTDGDGHSWVLGGEDCDDSEPTVHPGALEIVGNGVDDNCLGGDLAEPWRPAAPNPAPVSPARDVLLITIDALRADTLDATDDSGAPLMPNLRAFAAAGALFPRTYVPAPYTYDSMLALLSGRLPLDYADDERLLGVEETLMERLAAAGYRTACLQQIWLFSLNGLLGCQHVDTTLASHNAEFRGRTSEAMTDLALARLQAQAAEAGPHFLSVHYFDLHSNYLPWPGAPVADRSHRGRYLQEAWATDRALGRLFAELDRSGFLDRGVVLVTSDHGELLGERGRLGHGWWVDEPLLRVPLVLRGPGVPAGVFPTRIRALDVYATLLELGPGLGFVSDGVSLTPILRGAETADRDVFVFSRYKQRKIHAVIQGPWKLVRDLSGGAEHLYRVDAEVPEAQDFAGSEPDRLAALRLALGRQEDRSYNDVMLRRKLSRLDQRLPPRALVEAHNREVDRWECDHGDAAACERLR